MDMTEYGVQFFQGHQAGAVRSARHIVPIVLELVRPRRVIDLGCGTGAWLSVFTAFGVPDVWGVDGDYVDRRMLLIPAERFLARNLEAPFRARDRFDLVVSLEVAEHLPPASA